MTEQNLDGAEKIELLFVDFDKFVEMVLHNEFGDQELKIRFLEAKKMDAIKQQFGM